LIITSDHGQGLGSHNWWGHGRNIYNEQIHVPFIFYFSSEVGKGLMVDRMVEHVDIFPTVLELVGGNTEQLKEIKGESLVPFIFSNPGKKYRKKYVFSQRRFYEPGNANKSEPGEKNKTMGEKYALQIRDYKYIYSTHEEDGFFELRSDPCELNNRVNSGTPEEGQLKKTLLALIKYLKQKAPSEHLPVDKETIECLKSLGYIQ
jgi:choline-sulfatase